MVQTTTPLLLYNARLWSPDPLPSSATAVLVQDGRIAWLGSDHDARHHAPPSAQAINLAGRVLMPGIIDSHFHLLMGARWRYGAQLDSARTVDALQALVHDFAAAHPDHEWITGRGWQYAAFQGMPIHRRLLDAVVPDRPVCLTAFDGHTAWVNTRALERAGILRAAPPLEFGEVVMDADGATGELREPPAMNLVRSLIPPVPPDAEAALLRAVLRECAAFGITSVHNMDGDADSLAAYRAFDQRGELTVRVYVPLLVEPGTHPDALEAWAHDTAALHRAHHTSASAMVRTGLIKLFADGVIEARTAWLLEPYTGSASRGMLNFDEAAFFQLIARADALGQQVAVHAVGDAAVRLALDAFAHARAVNGARDSRHRVEHVELLHPDDVPRFAALGALASMQPLHAEFGIDDSNPWQQAIGPARWDRGFLWRDLLGAGAPLAFGSDWPVVTMNPFAGIRAALTRPTIRVNGGWTRDQRLSLEITLRGYTSAGAYFEFAEREKGMLAPGALADLVVLDSDLFAIAAEAPHQLDAVRSALTIVNGCVVHDAL